VARHDFRTWHGPGRRPTCWYILEIGCHRPPNEREQSTLYEAGLLDPDECSELERAWRRAFDEAQAPGFCFYGVRRHGSEMVALTGRKARSAQYREHDIPRSLVTKWEVAWRASS
jgi:hypothetical protein